MSRFTTEHAAKYFGVKPKRLRDVMRKCGIRIGSGNRYDFDGPGYAYLCERLQSAGLAPGAPADCRPPRVPAEERAAARDAYEPFANAFRRKN